MFRDVGRGKINIDDPSEKLNVVIYKKSRVIYQYEKKG